MENPVMCSDEKIVSMLSTIRNKQMFEFDCDMKKQMVWDLIESLYPVDMDPEQTGMKSLKSNHSKKFSKETGRPVRSEGVLIEMVWNIFLNGLWWETHGSDSEAYYLSQGETMRHMKSFSRRFRSKNEEIKKLEKANEEIMEEKGLISQKELDRLLQEQKEKYNQMLDDKYIENRNKYKTLQKQVSDLKSQLNHTMSTLNQVKLENEHLRKENAHFESMDT